MNKISVKFENHFKLQIAFRYKIVFESELINNDIDFYFEKDQPDINVSIRYFFKHSDAIEIDKIIRNNQIITSSENQIADYEEERQIQKIYIKVAVVAILIFFLACIASNYFN